MPYSSCPFFSNDRNSTNMSFIPPMPNMGTMNPPCSCYQMPSYDDFDIYDDEVEIEGFKRVNDPPPILSDNPAVPSISLFKELTAYPNYGNPSGNADILYTGNTGTWRFNLPTALLVPANLRGQLLIRAVLDDHSNVDITRYSARITFNGTVVHNGRVPLEHGVPVGQRFNNWRTLTFNVTNIRRNNRVVIANTSGTGANDWIAFDWMELRFAQR